MTSTRLPQLAPTIFIGALMAACANPKRIEEGPITVMRNGDRVESPVRTMDAAGAQALDATTAGRERRDSLTAAALSNCAPATCDAVARGEVVPGMTESQLLAATRTTEMAWSARRSGATTVLMPREMDASPRDAIAPVAMVQLANGAVSNVTYREPQGLRTVSSAADGESAGRVRAAALVREGDALAAAGDFTSALDRYDRAGVVTRADAELQYKMATSLEKLLRPREAELRYRLFLNQLEIQKIDAQGSANAKLADAIVHARERLVVLERGGR